MKQFRKYLFFIGFICSCSGCSYQLETAVSPDNLIPQDTFTMVLHEVMILESYFKAQQVNPFNYYDSLTHGVNNIFQKYYLDSTRFSSSFEYYAKKPKKLRDIYNAVQDSIVLETAKYNI